MKLSQNYNYRQSQQNHEFELFKQQIMRQGATFGLVYGNSPDNERGRLFNHGSGNLELYDVESEGVWESTISATVFGLVDNVKNLVILVQRGIAGIIEGIAKRRQQRKVIDQWLRLSDHLLEDIGLVRSEIEDLRLRGGDPEAYIQEARINRRAPQRYMRLIDCSRSDPKVHDDQGQRDARPDTRLHKAA